LAASLPLLILWIAAPEITWAMARERREDAEPLAEDDRRFLRGLARRTWIFFETFAGPEDNWLPPDNYQGAPHAEIAQRTSPTNIGMLMLSTAAAWDLGYIGRSELAARTANLFATLDRLERYRGHFYNWYDTRTLASLEPRYVSTVDSGNLAAALLAYAASLREARRAEGMEEQRWRGLIDVIDLIEQVAQNSEDAALPRWITQLRSRLEGVEEDRAHWMAGLQDICEVLIPEMVAALGLGEQSEKAAPNHLVDIINQTDLVEDLDAPVVAASCAVTQDFPHVRVAGEQPGGAPRQLVGAKQGRHFP
jgi:cyclic beta-1,2-glucan synthetase